MRKTHRCVVLLIIVAALATASPLDAANPSATPIPETTNLQSIACVPGGPHAPCLAAGVDESLTHAVVLEVNDGHPSTPILLPRSPGVGPLACSASGRCVTTGLVESAGPAVVFLDRDGTTDHIVPVSGTDSLTAIACPTTSTCLAIGFLRDNVRLPVTTLAVVKQNQSSAVAQPIAGGLVSDIACPSSTRCIAVGVGFDIVFDGPAWTSSLNTLNLALAGIACPSRTVCYSATRVFQAGFPFGAVVQIAADGTVGTPVPMAQYGTTFFDIACIDAHACVAVGENEQTTLGTVVRVLDGVPGAPGDVDDSNFFAAVACNDKSRMCTAVGSEPRVLIPILGTGTVGVLYSFTA
jgi:hypothetical protein